MMTVNIDDSLPLEFLSFQPQTELVYADSVKVNDNLYQLYVDIEETLIGLSRMEWEMKPAEDPNEDTKLKKNQQGFNTCLKGYLKRVNVLNHSLTNAMLPTIGLRQVNVMMGP